MTVVEQAARETDSAEPAPTGPTDDRPALHLMFPVVRPKARMTGDDIRLDLLRRMQSRAPDEQPRAA